MNNVKLNFFFFLINILIIVKFVICIRHQHYTKEDIRQKREEVRDMFHHAYNGYLTYASGYDELRPLTCDGINTWGSYSLTLIDALDTLAVMGNYTEFRRVVDYLVNNSNFDSDINVSVFETNIRIVGGLLSAHLMSRRAGIDLEPGWPCNGPLLRMAEDVARRLLPAFDTKTGMPYGTVNLRYGVPSGETSITCTAGVGTFLVEFGALSRLTGDPIYEEVALNAVYALWKYRSPLGLFGNHIDVQTGRWTAQDAGIGAGVDSYFEYLVKGAIMLNRPDLLEMFHESRRAIDKYLKKEDWYVWVSMNKGHVTLPVFQSLEAFWPGVLSLIGDIEPAIKTFSKYHTVWSQYGFLPEFYNIPNAEATANRESYPLRPELIESAMLLYRATKDQYFLEVGDDMLTSIQHSSRTKCGYATIKNIRNHERDNRMESFFLAETTKYLYLLFDPENYLHNDGSSGIVYGDCIIEAGNYIFNTEAHPIDPAALHCCYDMSRTDIFKDFNLDDYRSNTLVMKERKELIKKQEEISKQFSCPQVKRRDANITIDIEFSIDIDSNLTASEKFASQILKKQEQVKEMFDDISSHNLPLTEIRKQNLKINLDTWELLQSTLTKRMETSNDTLNTREIAGLLLSLTKGIFINDKYINDSSYLQTIFKSTNTTATKSLYDLYLIRQNTKLKSKINIDFHEYHKKQNKIGNHFDLDWLMNFVVNILTMYKNNVTDNNNDSIKLDTQIYTDVMDILLNGQKIYEDSMESITEIYNFIIEFTGNINNDYKKTLELLKGFKLLEKQNIPPNDKIDTKSMKLNFTIFENYLQILELRQKLSETLKKLESLTFEETNTETKSNIERKNDDDDDIILVKENIIEKESGVGTVEPITESELKNDNLINTNNHEYKSKEHLVKINDENLIPKPPPNNLKSYLDENKSVIQNPSENSSILTDFVQSILKSTLPAKPKFESQALLEKIRNRTNSEYMKFNENWELFTCKAAKFLQKISVQGVF